MLLNEKTKILNDLSEAELRQDVIIPLLNRMDYYYPIENHGQGERGKDIIFYDKDKMGINRFYSAVVKKGDITGDISSNRSFREVIYQIEQCFNISYKNVYEMDEVYVNHVLLITSGRVVSNSENSIFETLRKNNLDKNITIINREKLIYLIDLHFASYWDQNVESKEGLLIQKKRIIKFLDDVLSKFGVSKKSVEDLKRQLLNSNYDLSIIKADKLYELNTHGSFVTFDEKSKKIPDYLYSDQCGMLLYVFEEIREKLRHVYFDVEENLERYNNIIKIAKPQEFIDYFNDNMRDDYPFWNNSFGDVGDIKSEIEYLEMGLNDIERFDKYLKKNRIKDIYYKNCKYLSEQSDKIQKIINACIASKLHLFIIESNDGIIVISQSC